MKAIRSKLKTMSSGLKQAKSAFVSGRKRSAAMRKAKTTKQRVKVLRTKF